MRAVVAVPLLMLCCTAARPNSGPIQPVFRLSDFPTPLRIDNWFLPMKAGTRIVAHELEDGECKVNDVVVTDLVKHDFRGAYAGIAARAVFDRVWSDPKCDGTRHLLLENTTDWYGQDKHGNVWYFGEATKEFKDDGTVDTMGSFESGVNGALPGIVMPGHPQVGDQYRQEYAKGVAEDTGEVLNLAGRETTPLTGPLSDLLVTKDADLLDPTAPAETKYYARSIGLILTTEAGGRDEAINVEKF